MRRLTPFICMSLTAVAVLASAVHAELLRVGQVSAPRSAEQIRVPITLDNGGAIGGIVLRVNYDPTRLQAIALEAAARTADFELFAVNLEEAGVATLVAIAAFVGGGATPPLGPGSGPIAELVLRPLPDVPEGTTSLPLAEGSLSSPEGQLISTALEDGWVQLNADVPVMTASWGTLKAAYP